MKLNVIYVIILMIFLIPCASANNIDDLINSYDYDFYTNAINVASQTDTLTDTNSNSMPDTLNIIAQTNISNSNYIMIVSLDNINNNLINYANITTQTTTITFPTKDIYTFPLKYSIEIRDNNYNLLYLKNNLSTNTYATYEQGPTINSITDSNDNNQNINLTLNMNTDNNEIAEITLYLNYNEQMLTQTQNITMQSPQTITTLQIPKDKISQTHYNGTYQINKIKINNKVHNINHTTNSYNFEDFTTDSYIKTISHNLYDANNNELYDYLNFNFEIQTIDTNNYLLEFNLYDEDNNFIQKINKTFTGTNSIQNIQPQINGKELYKLKSNTQYKLSNINLKKQNITIDAIKEEYLTETINYISFERPALPDLTLNMNAIFNEQTNSTNVTIGITNIGNMTAFNINLDIFSLEIQNKIIIPYIDVNQTQNYSLLVKNDTQGNIYTAIADLKNTVDEQNESNNIEQTYSIGANTVKLDAEINVLDEGLVELILDNTGYINLYNLEINFSNHTLTGINLNKDIKKILFLPLNLTLDETYLITIKSGFINKTISFTYNNGSNKDYIINYLDNNLTEITIENTYEGTKSYSFQFNNKNYSYILEPSEKKRMLIDASQQNLENFLVKDFSVIEEFTQLESVLYEIILKNLYDSAKMISFNLGNSPHSFNLAENERKVVYIDSNQSNLEIEDLEVQ